MSLKNALLKAVGDEDDGGEPNPPTGDSDDGRDYRG
jgi:hypothetical protein